MGAELIVAMFHTEHFLLCLFAVLLFFSTLKIKKNKKQLFGQYGELAFNARESPYAIHLLSEVFQTLPLKRLLG